MRVSAHRLLAAALVGSLSATFLWPGARVDDPPPPLPADLAAPVPEVRTLRSIAKWHIARDLAAGRCSLVDAAALFGALNRLPPAVPDLSIGRPCDSPLDAPARTEAERLCRQVATWVDAYLRRTAPDRIPWVTDRLREEYAAALRGGPIRLPDAASLQAVDDLLARAARDPAASRPDEITRPLPPAPSR